MNFYSLSSFGTGGIALNGRGVQRAASYTGGDLSSRKVTIIGNGGAGSLTKIGAGILTLLGPKTYTYTELIANLSLASTVVIIQLQTWLQTYLGTTTNTGIATDTADFDSDGNSNLLEYATGTNHTAAGGAAGHGVAPLDNVLALTCHRIADTVPFTDGKRFQRLKISC